MSCPSCSKPGKAPDSSLDAVILPAYQDNKRGPHARPHIVTQKLSGFIMSRVCVVSGKAVMTGHHVSHANNKTKRRFLPNLQVTSIFSETLGKPVRLRLTTNGLRTVEHKGGIDAFLIEACATKLPADLRRAKKQIEAKMEAAKAA